MSELNSYSIYLDKTHIGLILSAVPLFHEKITESDRSTWGRFEFQNNPKMKLSWLQQRKISHISEKIATLYGLTFPQSFFMFPATKPDIDIKLSETETDFLAIFADALSRSGVDVLQIYPYPKNPNHHSKETYAESFQLKMLTEYQFKNNREELAAICTRFIENVEIKFNDNSIFPELYKNGQISCSPGISFIKFISYFRDVISKLNNLYKLSKNLQIPEKHFPYVIESFTVEFIPSFTKDHNIVERIGDSILDVIVSTTMIKALIKKKNYYINKQIRNAVSNKLFGIIGDQFDFKSCFIGPDDIEKLEGDCFEALTGSIFKLNGYDAASQFWTRTLFAIPAEALRGMDIVKTVESMKLGIESDAVDLTPDADPPADVAKLLCGLKAPPKAALEGKDDLQTKCKLIGAAILKHAVVNAVVSGMRTAGDTALIPVHSSKEALTAVARSVGLGTSRRLRTVVGGIMLQNGYDKTMHVVAKKIMPHFHIWSHKN